MVIGTLYLNIRLHGITSLKGKRKISLSLKQKIKNKFNLAVAEVGSENSLDHLEIAMVTLANDKIRVEKTLHKALKMVESNSTDDIQDVKIEVF